MVMVMVRGGGGITAGFWIDGWLKDDANGFSSTSDIFFMVLVNIQMHSNTILYRRAMT
jgi:hypothetical protein